MHVIHRLRPYFAVCFLSMLLAGCGVLWEYRSLESFDEMQWSKNDTLTFEFEIEASGTHDIDVLVRHVQGFPFAELGILAITQGPGWSDSKLLVIPVIGSDRQYLGDGSGDMFDLQHTLHPALPLTKGVYRVQLIHQMQKDPLPLVMEAGLQVSKAQ